MELELSEDQEFFRSTTRKFLEAESPLTAVRALAGEADGFDREFWRRGAELGWTSMLVPEADGGGTLSGAGLLDLVLVAEEMGRLVSPGPLLPTNVVASALATSGTVGAAGAPRADRRRGVDRSLGHGRGDIGDRCVGADVHGDHDPRTDSRSRGSRRRSKPAPRQICSWSWR